MLQVTSANAWNATLYENLNFNFIRDIGPVASLIRAPSVLGGKSVGPAKTVPEFIAYAKANPGKLTMASSGIGTASQVFGEHQVYDRSELGARALSRGGACGY